MYYRDRRGREPVDDFINELRPRAAQRAFDEACALLNGLPPVAPPLAFPHSSQVDGELRELRCHYGRRLFRILYRRSRNLFVLLHGIEKTSGPLPATDIAVANARFADFQTRMEASKRVPPRPIGQDAPPARRTT